MARPLSQLLPPDLPSAGASPQFGNSSQAGGTLNGGHLNSAANLKSLLQLPVKGDQRGKDCTEMKVSLRWNITWDLVEEINKARPFSHLAHYPGKDRMDIDEDSLGRCPLRNGCSNGLVADSNGAGTGSFSNSNNSSFLGPLLWERTLPCDGGLFQLQYMDLEEFLTENGMSSMHSTSNSTSAQIPSQSPQSAIPNQGSQCLPTSPPHCSSSSSPTATTASSSPSLLGLDMHTPQSMLGTGDCLHAFAVERFGRFLGVSVTGERRAGEPGAKNERQRRRVCVRARMFLNLFLFSHAWSMCARSITCRGRGRQSESEDGGGAEERSECALVGSKVRITAKRGTPPGSLEPTPSPSSTTCPPLPTPPIANCNDMLAPFDPDPADVALSSVPGQEAFDPRRHRFSEEELKPQPMIKKARKMLVPDDLKDEKYWSRRCKNNEAAKRSRDARRLKENQISVRAAFLERENAALRQEVADMRKELGRCRNILNKYESHHMDQ
ncbi:Hepatic leukemia factor [Labeo rohita]|uniref:Hepatic leukemia factor n=1 Tax=Labeo rohita TaxID=84645 RepID=A0ABQ8LXN1_LABRO|nr:Hepatic leukemia factor [Labeo rohita]